MTSRPFQFLETPRGESLVISGMTPTNPTADIELPMRTDDVGLQESGPVPETPGWRLKPTLRHSAIGVARLVEWLFGLASLIVGLSVLATLPILQFLSLGYFLESSGRVAKSGRPRDGLIGVRRFARFGSAALGTGLALLPLGLIGSFAASAEVIHPGGPIAARWRIAAFFLAVLTVLQIGVSLARGGRLRSFAWPIGNALWLFRELRRGGLYGRTRDAFWNTLVALRLPHYFRLGMVGFFGTLAWLVVPATLIAASQRFPVLGVLGALLLLVIAPWLPFLQVRYAVESRWRVLFAPRAARDRFRRAPWAFAFALMVLLVASIPLYLLKIEMVPREAAWLPGLVFVLFLAPAHLLVGWAYARSERRESPRHWLFRLLGRLAILPVAFLYVLVVVLAQYTSWGGVTSLYEQHAFLLPIPFNGR